MSLATSIADMNHAYNLALTTLRAKIVVLHDNAKRDLAAHEQKESKNWEAGHILLQERVRAYNECITLIDKDMKS